MNIIDFEETQSSSGWLEASASQDASRVDISYIGIGFDANMAAVMAAICDIVDMSAAYPQGCLECPKLRPDLPIPGRKQWQATRMWVTPTEADAGVLNYDYLLHEASCHGTKTMVLPWIMVYYYPHVESHSWQFSSYSEEMIACFKNAATSSLR